MAKRMKKTTRTEYQELLDFVERNKVLIKGKAKPSEALNVKQLWESFANKMVSATSGPSKTADQWRKIFVEWKVNVRRKSRRIREEMCGTEGGSSDQKPLTDVEEKLLKLIGHIHVEERTIPDSLGDPIEVACERAMEEIEVIVPHSLSHYKEIKLESQEYLELSPVEISQDIIEFSESLKPSREVHLEESISEQPQTSKKPPKCTPSRYTNQILESACESYKNANENNMQGLLALAQSIDNFASVYKLRAEAEMLKARAEYAKAKCLHFQTFNNLDDFK